MTSMFIYLEPFDDPCFDRSLDLVLEGYLPTKIEDIHRFQVFIACMCQLYKVSIFQVLSINSILIGMYVYIYIYINNGRTPTHFSWTPQKSSNNQPGRNLDHKRKAT